MSKIYIGWYSILTNTNLSYNKHTYLVMDPNDNLSNTSDQEIIRGGDENLSWSEMAQNLISGNYLAGSLAVEDGVASSVSVDGLDNTGDDDSDGFLNNDLDYDGSADTTGERHYTEVDLAPAVTLYGSVDAVWNAMEAFTTDLGDSGYGYKLPSWNCQATVVSALSSVGVDFAQNVPLGSSYGEWVSRNVIMNGDGDFEQWGFAGDDKFFDTGGSDTFHGGNGSVHSAVDFSDGNDSMTYVGSGDVTYRYVNLGNGESAWHATQTEGSTVGVDVLYSIESFWNGNFPNFPFLNNAIDLSEFENGVNVADILSEELEGYQDVDGNIATSVAKLDLGNGNYITFVEMNNFIGTAYTDVFSVNNILGRSFDGGDQVDAVDYALLTNESGLTINLINQDAYISGSSFDSPHDDLLNLENVVGSQYSDSITGDNNDNELRGGDGDDLLQGKSGSDSLYGDAGNDLMVIEAPSTGEVIYAYGGDGDDRLAIKAYQSEFTQTSGANNETILTHNNTGAEIHVADDVEVMNFLQDDTYAFAGAGYENYAPNGYLYDIYPSFSESPVYRASYEGQEEPDPGYNEATATFSSSSDLSSGTVTLNWRDAGNSNDARVSAIYRDELTFTVDGADENTVSYITFRVTTSVAGDTTGKYVYSTPIYDKVQGAGYFLSDNLYYNGNPVGGGTGGNPPSFSSLNDADNSVLEVTYEFHGPQTTIILARGLTLHSEGTVGNPTFGTVKSTTEVVNLDSSITMTSESGLFGTQSPDDSPMLVSGSDWLDEIFGSWGSDYIQAEGGDDVIAADLGDDHITAGAGNDTIDGGDGFDEAVFSGVFADYTINGSTVTDNVGSDGTDTLTNVERLVFADGTYENGIFTPASPDDTFAGTSGADTFDGGIGSDTVDYSASSAGIQINLSNGSASGGDAQGDTLISIENIIGTDYADTLTGNDDSNTFTGGAGNDDVFGGGGEDIIFGGDGDDYLKGEGNNDTLDGGAGNDTLIGGYGADTLTGGAGNDDLNGGNSADTLFGDAGIDTLSGGDGHDWLYGGDDADTLYGNADKDHLFGGAGADVLYGGNDSSADGKQDIFYFEASSAFDAVDTIIGFSGLGGMGGGATDMDKIDLSDVLDGFGYDPVTHAIEDWVNISASGSDSVVQVDRDGAGSTYGFADIVTVTNTTVVEDDLITV